MYCKVVVVLLVVCTYCHVTLYVQFSTVYLYLELIGSVLAMVQDIAFK
jgi:hypothetical protein